MLEGTTPTAREVDLTEAKEASPGMGRFVRLSLVASVLLNIVLGAIAAALWDPLELEEPTLVYPTPTANPSPSASRPAYQFAPVSSEPVPGSLQCPDAGSVAAGDGDIKTEVLEIKGVREKPAVLLGPNRRIVIAEKAVMSGAVTICGDGGTVLIIGTQAAPVVMRGSGVKIVIQDGDASKLPPAYFTTNGTVLRCATTASDPDTPSCDNYQPRPRPAK